jgi:hypothetical protein
MEQRIVPAVNALQGLGYHDGTVIRCGLFWWNYEG